mmetsp:Transcript_14619/g.35648  ORF Transcript_14619/g.35648 Transcript_14619/m.35648 type:complete len:140 (-) Transcript_14619:526-945(-)
MLHRASMKLGLDQAVLHTMEGQGSEKDRSKRKKRLMKGEVEALLKHGAYHVFLNQDESQADEFCEQDIDSILQRHSRVVTVGNEKGEGEGKNGLLQRANSRFSKASFVSDEQGVDLNDPEFWAKIGLKKKASSGPVCLG